MTYLIKTLSQLTTQLEALIIDNTSGNISAQDARTTIGDLIASAINRVTDLPLLGLREYSSTRGVYTVGEACISGTAIYKCIEETQGAFNPAKWQVIEGFTHYPVSISTTAGNGLSIGATSQVLSLALASASNAGALSAADWATFNGKQDALGYTPINKAGDTGISGSLLFNNALNIDTVTAGHSISIGGVNAGTVNVGINASTINIGTGSGAKTINIGNTLDTIILTGTVVSENVTNVTVSDRLITLNKGGSASSAVGAGLEIEEGSSITGYIKTTGGRDGYLFKAPVNSYDTSLIFAPTAARQINVPDATGTMALTSDLVKTVNKAAQFNSSTGALEASSVTNTELGYLSGATSGIQTQINAKEGTIAAGLSSQYWRGDKTWQTLNTAVVPEGSNLYYTQARWQTEWESHITAGVNTVPVWDNTNKLLVSSLITSTGLASGNSVNIAGTKAVGTPGSIESLLFIDTTYNIDEASASASKIGLRNRVKYTPTGTIAQAIGAQINLLPQSGTIADLMGLHTIPQITGSANITNLYHLYLATATNGGTGTISNQYGLYIPTLGNATNNWGIYVSSNNSVLGGSLSVGHTATPAYQLHVQKDQNGNSRIGLLNTDDGTSASTQFIFATNTTSQLTATLAMYGVGYTPTPSFAGKFVIRANSAGSNGILLSTNSGPVVISSANLATEDLRVDAGAVTVGGKLLINRGTITAASPAIDVTSTWNNAAVAFTSFKYNITDTASSAASLLMDLQVGSASKFAVDKLGAIVTASLVFTDVAAGVKANAIKPNISVNGAARTMRFDNASTSTNEGFQFYNSNSSTSLLFIQQDGKIGIGTTLPGEKLDLWDGAMYVSATGLAHGMTSVVPTTTAGRILKNNTSGGLAVSGYSADANGSGLALVGNMGAGSSTVAAVGIVGTVKSGTTVTAVAATDMLLNIANGNAATRKLVILGNGNVGLGGTAAPGATLDLWDGSMYYSTTGVAHGMTTLVPTTTSGKISNNNSSGGLAVQGFANSTSIGLVLSGTSTTSTTVPAITMLGRKQSGTGVAAIANTELLLTITNNLAVKFSLFGNGDITLTDGAVITTGSTTGLKLASATTDKIGFYGTAPIAQRSGAAQNAVATTASTAVTPFGYSTQAQADSIVTLLNELRAWAVAIGFIKGAV